MSEDKRMTFEELAQQEFQNKLERNRDLYKVTQIKSAINFLNEQIQEIYKKHNITSYKDLAYVGEHVKAVIAYRQQHKVDLVEAKRRVDNLRLVIECEQQHKVSHNCACEVLRICKGCHKSNISEWCVECCESIIKRES